jgi:nuclear pore complex protein Nup188
MAYMNFLKAFYNLKKRHVFSIELPGLIFLLREVFPHIHTWRFDDEDERMKLYVAILLYFFDILQIPQQQLDLDKSRQILRDACVSSLLNMDNGMTLLK